MWVLIGDFNEVRAPEERRFSEFCARSADVFNDFILHGNVKEYPMGGARYTFSYGNGVNFSKLDRILVCEEFFNRWPRASLRALPRMWSDHSPLIFKCCSKDFGPVPFRFFSSWLKFPELVTLIREGLAVRDSSSDAPDIKLCRKLKHVKGLIKNWVHEHNSAKNRDIQDLITFCSDMDVASESSYGSNLYCAFWLLLLGIQQCLVLLQPVAAILQ
ncbi:hypothetical protein SSX86_022872 [Deinandra increscens subsp. villosa]|uniref:Reverse transcriptase n=1 Tax=Deinandra increscens subsp. villosa TaxID=3103831 RepID=A0AAP0GRK3_9ASTR